MELVEACNILAPTPPPPTCKTPLEHPHYHQSPIYFLNSKSMFLSQNYTLNIPKYTRRFAPASKAQTPSDQVHTN